MTMPTQTTLFGAIERLEELITTAMAEHENDEDPTIYDALSNMDLPDRYMSDAHGYPIEVELVDDPLKDIVSISKALIEALDEITEVHDTMRDQCETILGDAETLL